MPTASNQSLRLRSGSFFRRTRCIIVPSKPTLPSRQPPSPSPMKEAVIRRRARTSRKEQIEDSAEGRTKDADSDSGSKISYLGDLTIKSDPCEEYLEYANFSRRRHPCMRKPREAAREEFAKCLQETNLNADNVEGILKVHIVIIISFIASLLVKFRRPDEANSLTLFL